MPPQRFTAEQTLNEWHFMFFSIYGLRNSERDAFKLFAHLVEVAGGLQKVVRKGSDPVNAAAFLGKLLAWYSALARRLGYNDLESLVWQKYAGACPYCGSPRCECVIGQPSQVLPGAALRRLQHENRHRRPERLASWQEMFMDIYGIPGGLLLVEPAQLSSSRSQMLIAMNRLGEELAELAEAIRLEHVFPMALTSELADVFAWMMAAANIMPQYTGDPRFSLEEILWSQYPGYCSYCYKETCSCPNDRVRPSLVASAGREDDDLLPDELTGLPRKDRFERTLAESVLRATDQVPLSLIVADLDHFKSVNDKWGHLFGDKVLAGAAEIIRRVTASHSASAFRWGGEEFTIILPNRSGGEALAFAERLRNEIASVPFEAPDGTSHVQTLSCGVATLVAGVGGSSAAATRSFFEAADGALYAAKGQGRNRAVVAGENLT